MNDPKFLEDSLRKTLQIMLETDPNAVMKIEQIKSEVLGMKRFADPKPAENRQLLH